MEIVIYCNSMSDINDKHVTSIFLNLINKDEKCLSIVVY